MRDNETILASHDTKVILAWPKADKGTTKDSSVLFAVFSSCFCFVSLLFVCCFLFCCCCCCVFCLFCCNLLLLLFCFVFCFVVAVFCVCVWGGGGGGGRGVNSRNIHFG